MAAAQPFEVGLDRPLADAEFLVRAVARSEAVIAGRLVSLRDTTAPRGGGGAGDVGRFEICRIRPERWLKGSPVAGDLVAVNDRSWIDQDPPRSEIAGWDGTTSPPRAEDRVIAFLERDSLDMVAPPGTYLAAIRSVSRWSVDPGFSMTRIPGLQKWSPARESLVVTEVSHQSPDSLIARAEVICTIRLNLRARWDSITVESALRGAHEGDRLRARMIRGFVSDVRRGGTALLLLRRAADGVYEPVSLDAGVLTLVGDRLPAWRCTLADVRARVVQSDARHAQ